METKDRLNKPVSQEFIKKALSKRSDEPIKDVKIKDTTEIIPYPPHSRTRVFLHELEITYVLGKRKAIKIIEKRFDDHDSASREALALRFFRRAFGEDERSHIPFCYDSQSRALIKDYMEGKELSEVLSAINTQIDQNQSALEQIASTGTTSEKEELAKKIQFLNKNKIEYAFAIARLLGKFHYFSSIEISKTKKVIGFLGKEWPILGSGSIINSFLEDIRTLTTSDKANLEKYLGDIRRALINTEIPMKMNGVAGSTAPALIIGDLHPRNIFVCGPKPIMDNHYNKVDLEFYKETNLVRYLRIVDLDRAIIGNPLIDVVDLMICPCFDILPLKTSVEETLDLDHLIETYAKSVTSYDLRVPTSEYMQQIKEQIFAFSPMRAIRSAANVSGEQRRNYIKTASAMMKDWKLYEELYSIISKIIPEFSEQQKI